VAFIIAHLRRTSSACPARISIGTVRFADGCLSPLSPCHALQPSSIALSAGTPIAEPSRMRGKPLVCTFHPLTHNPAGGTTPTAAPARARPRPALTRCLSRMARQYLKDSRHQTGNRSSRVRAGAPLSVSTIQPPLCTVTQRAMCEMFLITKEDVRARRPIPDIETASSVPADRERCPPERDRCSRSKRQTGCRAPPGVRPRDSFSCR
jgi:hypothetical protein